MGTAVIVVALVAALACPLHMLWHARRGHGAHPDGRRSGRGEQAGEDLRASREPAAAELVGPEAAERRRVPS
jgi:hypothetical protein